MQHRRPETEQLFVLQEHHELHPFENKRSESFGRVPLSGSRRQGQKNFSRTLQGPGKAQCGTAGNSVRMHEEVYCRLSSKERVGEC